MVLGAQLSIENRFSGCWWFHHSNGDCSEHSCFPAAVRLDGEVRSQGRFPPFPVLPTFRKFFRFVIADTVYQFIARLWPVYSSERVFTKTLAPLVHLLRFLDIKVHAYLDVWLLRADPELLYPIPRHYDL